MEKIILPYNLDDSSLSYQKNTPRHLSVTQATYFFKQPRGGLLPLSYFKQRVFSSFKQETVIPANLAATVGLTVDNLSRYLLLKKGFEIATKGIVTLYQIKSDRYNELGKLFQDNFENIKSKTVKGILDDSVIISAIKIVQLDSIYRANSYPMRNINETFSNLDSNLLNYIKILILRTENYILNLVKSSSLVSEVTPGFDMEGGYTNRIVAGDGDYLVNGDVLDLKTSKYRPNPRYTLQVLLYFLMGQHSKQRYWRNASGILRLYSPILNTEWAFDTKQLPDSLIDFVNKRIIEYRS